MSRIGDTFGSETLAAAAAARTAKRGVPEAFRDVDPAVLAYCLRQVDGVWERLSIDDKGQIIAHNRPVW